MSFRNRFMTALAGALLLAAALSNPSAFAQTSTANGPVIVFAAASLKNALDAASASWQKEQGDAVKISYAASSTLAKQMEEDAPAQIFISADEDWMNYVEGKGLIAPGTRF